MKKSPQSIKIKPHYSGPTSINFWKHCNSLSLFKQGLKLQELEAKILKLINNSSK